MIDAIWAFIGGIPSLVNLIDSLIASYQKRKANAWLAQENEVINNEIPAAETQDELLKASKDLQDLTKNIGK